MDSVTCFQSLHTFQVHQKLEVSQFILHGLIFS